MRQKCIRTTTPFVADTDCEMADSELIGLGEELQYGAGAVQYNSEPFTLSRMGAYVRTTANSTNTPGSAAWVTDLVNNGLNPSFSFSGVVSEVIVFNRKLTPDERDTVYSYLSKKYGLDARLPDTQSESHPSAATVNQSYWDIEIHPNTKGIAQFPAGTEFSGVCLSAMLKLPDLLYKSSGTVLANGNVLSGDTYDIIP